jgi:acetoacetate decarboxylase
MKHETARASAFAMPLTNPAFPSGPYRFFNREYFISSAGRIPFARMGKGVNRRRASWRIPTRK